ncbi:MAG: hypothetical protein AAGB22_06980, partial [Bacteroidota bacterium]
LLHPPQAARLKAITRGWQEAAALRGKKAYSPQTASRGPNADYPIARFAFKCRFKGDDNVYFVDQAQQVVWFDNYGKPIVIGNVSESESERYEWMYYYQDKIYGIDHKGVIWKETTHGASLQVGRAEVIAEPENPTH